MTARTDPAHRRYAPASPSPGAGPREGDRQGAGADGAARARPVDLETRIHDDHHAALRLWLRMLSCTNLIARELRRRLREEFDCTLSRFDLMAQLERAPGGLTMSEVSQRLMVTNAAITGLADRLVEEGYLERSGDRADRRTFRLRLTAAGRAHFLTMATRHEAWIIELMAGVGDEQKGLLRQLIGELKATLPRR